jgi:predicted RNA-binding protein Jag
MNYTYNGKNYNVPDEEIDRLMDNLDISISEACETYLADKEIIESEEEKELTKKATKNRVLSTIHQAKGEKKERKAREKKENPLKKEIIQAILSGIANNINTDGEIVVTNDEKYIDFNVNGREFTVNLVEHRPKKEKK